MICFKYNFHWFSSPVSIITVAELLVKDQAGEIDAVFLLSVTSQI